MTIASSGDGDQHENRIAALSTEVLAVGRRSWGASWSPTRRAVAPGRIELLGNHLDYNGGKVLAAAIDRYILLLGESSVEATRIDVAYADPMSGSHFDDALDIASFDGWQRESPPESPTDYVRGAIAALVNAGMAIESSRIAFGGNLPVGLGVSSSAALSVGLVLMLAGESLTPKETILLAQAAENRAGVGSGTMDQAASVAGGVIRYDAAAISFERLDPDLGDLAFVVISSGVVHRLGESAYPTRVREMAELQAIVRRELGAAAPDHVAGVTGAQVEGLTQSGQIDATLQMRAAHVVTEVERVDQGYDALNAGDWVRFGELMTASGRSSATAYDISHPQVEELVADVIRSDGILGARMMGGGGGGSVLALVRQSEVQALSVRLDVGYFARHELGGLPDRVLVCTFSDGARLESMREPT